MKGPLLLLVALAAAPAQADTRRSGLDFMSPATQAMQRDDAQNPAMLWVDDGQALWQRGCAACHGDAARSMRGVAARYPAFDAMRARPVTLAQRVNLCRERHAQLPALPAESRELLALEAYVAMQSRGLPIQPPGDARLAPYRERGRLLYTQRMGQFDVACTQCHDAYAGRHLGGAAIPQAHPTGYPVYRLEWQGLGSLQRRLRACMTGVRAEPFAPDAIEWVELELFLKARAAGMAVETPGVRP